MAFVTTAIILLYAPMTIGLVTLDNFYPFGPNAGDTDFRHCLDCSTGAIRLENGFPFFGKNRTSIYVNSHGVITTNGPLTEWIPRPFPVSSKSYQMVAPFWADIDVRRSGNIFYRSSTNETLLSEASNEVQRYFPSLAQFNASFAFVVTYYEVPHFPNGYLLHNTLQCVLLTDYSNSIALYFYQNISWTTTTNSMGRYHAEVGFDSGDGEHYYKVTGSLTPDIKNINNRSNVGVPGKWAFRIDGKNVSFAVLPKVLSIHPDSGLAEGGYSINLTVSGLPNASIHYSYFCRQFHYNKYVDTVADRIDTETLNCQLAGIPFAGGYEMRIEAGVSIHHLEWVSDSYRRFRFWTCDEIDCGAHGVCHSGQCNCTLPYIGSYCQHEVKWPYIPDNKFELNLCELVDIGSLNLTVLAGQSPFDWSFQSDAIPPWLELHSVSNFSAQLTWTRPTFEFLYSHPIKIAVSNNFGKSIVNVDIKLLQAYETVISYVSPQKVLHLQPINVYGRLEALPQCNLSTLSQTAIIWLMHHNHRESFPLQSDDQGFLSYQYNPSERDIGNFSVMLTHPFIKPVNRSEVTIEIILLLVDVKMDHIAVGAGDQFNGTLAVLRNPNHRALTGITAQITLYSGSGNLKIQADDLSFPPMLGSNQSATLMLNTSFAPEDSGTISFAINITTDVGAYATIINIQIIVSMRVVEIMPDSGLAEGGYPVTLMVYGLLTGYNSTYFCRQYHYERYVDTVAKYTSTQNISCHVAGIPFAAGYNMRIEAGSISIDHSDLSVSNTNKKFHFWTCQKIDCGPHGACYSGKCNCTLPYTGSFCDQLVKWPYIPMREHELEVCEIKSVGSLNLTVAVGHPPFVWSFESRAPVWLTLLPTSNFSAQFSWVGPTFASLPPDPVVVKVQNSYGQARISIKITVLEAYLAIITKVVPEMVLKSSPVSIDGEIDPIAQCNISALSQRAIIWMQNEDRSESFEVDADDSGHFTMQFMPKETDLGEFSLRATHPFISSSKQPQASFKIERMYLQKRTTYFRAKANGEFSTTLALLENPNNVPLHNINLNIARSEGDLDLQTRNFTFPDMLYSKQTANVTLRAKLAPHKSGNNAFSISLSSAEGCEATMNFAIHVYDQNPQLQISPSKLDIQVERGGQKDIPVTIQNIGGEDAIRPEMPIPAGIIAGYHVAQLVKFSEELPQVIKARDQFQLTLTISIPQTIQLNYKIHLSLDLSWSLDWEDSKIFENRLDLDAVVVSDVLTNMTVQVKDELTYNAEGKPLVEGATVKVISTNGEFHDEKMTNSSGTLTFRTSEGYYIFQASAPKHARTQRGPILVTQYDSSVSLFVSKQGLSYSWGAKKTNITDKYNMTLKPHYDTDVPMPIVIVSPNPLPLRDLIQQQRTVTQVTLTNVGLIDAINVQLFYPKDIPGVQLVNNDTIAKLPAKTSGIFQVKIVLKDQSTYLAEGFSSNTGCGSCLGGYGYGYECGPTSVQKRGYQQIDYGCSKCPVGDVGKHEPTCTNCGNDPSGWTGGGVGDGWGGGGWGDGGGGGGSSSGSGHGSSSSDHSSGSRGQGSASGSGVSPPIHHDLPCSSSGGWSGDGGSWSGGDDGTCSAGGGDGSQRLKNCAVEAAKDLFDCVFCGLVPGVKLICKLFSCLDSLVGVIEDFQGRSGPWTVITLGADIISAFKSCATHGGYYLRDSYKSEHQDMNFESRGSEKKAVVAVNNTLNHQRNAAHVQEFKIDFCLLSKFIPYATFLPIPGIGCIVDGWNLAKTCWPSLNPCTGTHKGGGCFMRNTDQFSEKGEYLIANSHAMVASMAIPQYYFGGYYVFNSTTVNGTSWLALLQESLSNTSQHGRQISKQEMEKLSNNEYWTNVDDARQAKQFLLRLQNSITSMEKGEIPDGTKNTIDFQTVNALSSVYKKALNSSNRQGELGPFMAYSGQLSEMKDSALQQKHGVCSKATMEIDQELTLVRQAVNANLTVTNTLIGEEVSQIDAHIEFKESEQNHNDRFSIKRSVSGHLQPPIPHGPYSLGPGQGGGINWEAIPYKEAAPHSETVYGVTGNLTYDMDNSSVSIPLMPIPITIAPEPELFIDYFYQCEVYGDDPFTKVIEPSVPFLLAIFIGNRGYGPANGMHLSTMQPKIVDNKKGLLVSFKIIGAELNNETITPSFADVYIGSLKPQTSAVVQYWLTSSLKGNFTSFNLTMIHRNLHGDPKLNLVNSSSYHQLIKNVILPDIDDPLPSMLCADHPNDNPNPDTVYSSINGTKRWPVCSISGAIIKESGTRYMLKAKLTMYPGLHCPYIHISAENPVPEQYIISAKTGGRILDAQNYWTSYSKSLINVFDSRTTTSGSETSDETMDFSFQLSFSNESSECDSNRTIWLKGCDTCYCLSGSTFCTQIWSTPTPCTTDDDCHNGTQCSFYKRTACVKSPCLVRNYCVYNQTTTDNSAICGQDDVTCSFLELLFDSNKLEKDTSTYDFCSTMKLASLNILGHESPCMEMSCTLIQSDLSIKIAVKMEDNKQTINSSSVAKHLWEKIRDGTLENYLNGAGDKAKAIARSVSNSASTLKPTTIKTTTTATPIKESTTSNSDRHSTYPTSNQPDTSTQGQTSTTEETPTTTNTPKPLADDCGKLLKWNQSTSGIYNITFGSLTPNGTAVYCDQDSDGGGWTVFQRRVDGNTDFDQEWQAYTVDGIGRAHEGNYWIPLAVVANYSQKHNLELRIDIWDCFGRLSYEVYKQFEIDTTTYNISVSNPMGTAGDSFNSPNYGKQFIQNGTAFTTKDKDHDNLDEMNCADFYKGGWWFNECGISNLNGQYKEGCYYTSVFANGIIWSTWNEASYSAFKTEMKFRIVGL